jgi:hypothetical protein
MRDHGRSDDNLIESLYRSNRITAQELEDIRNKLPSAPVLIHETQVPAEPWQGMFVVDPSEQAFCFYLGDEWYCVKPSSPTFAIKVYSDTKPNQIGDGKFRFPIPEKVHGKQLVGAKAFNGTAASGSTTLNVANTTRGENLFTTPILIPSGAYVSNPVSINTGGPTDLPHHQAEEDDMMWVNVLAVGSTPGKGLGLYLHYE